MQGMQEKLANKLFLRYEVNKQLLMAKDYPRPAHLRLGKPTLKQKIKVAYKNAFLRLVFG